ncbi:hypothetical protein PRZ48_007853 [Zasmidium cellare]|uniref:Uncharacterized protein n=1 Tax=Zasmidium cellare TaxID=395010 RepID=A0ABR0EKL2_ZASCE|nr:hypothetical protein PRZ48_007853 [Zasmidium cellare]
MPKETSKSRTKTHPKPSSTKTGKDSHLYTDDNPSTTIHGTGFKDKAAAERTLELINKRSLIYQFQTVNTMYNRAKHHPAMKKAVEGSAGTSDMRAAMDVFRHWLDVTYPAERDALRAGGFKPLLSKKTVGKYLDRILEGKAVDDLGKQFAKMYCELPKGKKLGNVLVDDSKPEEADWERIRYDVLNELVPEGREESQDESWSSKDKVGDVHLGFIAWAWSPVPERKL